MDHVMIDIETLSLHPHKAVILSLGMIEFDPDGPELKVGCRSRFVLDIPSQLMMGRKVCRKTQKWWRDQPPEASHHWVHPETVTDPGVVVRHVSEFCSGAQTIWANGTQFDLSNIKHLARKCGFKAEMWHYQAARDARTYYFENEIVRGDVDDYTAQCGNLIAHEPVSDCIVQAYRVWQRRKPEAA